MAQALSVVDLPGLPERGSSPMSSEGLCSRRSYAVVHAEQFLFPACSRSAYMGAKVRACANLRFGSVVVGIWRRYPLCRRKRHPVQGYFPLPLPVAAGCFEMVREGRASVEVMWNWPYA